MAGTVVGTAAALCSPFDTALGRRYLDMLLTGPSPFWALAAASATARSFDADSSAAARLTDRYRVYLGWTVDDSASESWDMVGEGVGGLWHRGRSGCGVGGVCAEMDSDGDGDSGTGQQRP